MVAKNHRRSAMKKLFLFAAMAAMVLGVGCATVPSQDLMRQGALVNYRTDCAVVFLVYGNSGDGSISTTVPKAVKTPNGVKPGVATVNLFGKRYYWVETTRVGSEHPYQKGYIWVDKFFQDTLIEEQIYDFGIYAR